MQQQRLVSLLFPQHQQVLHATVPPWLNLPQLQPLRPEASALVVMLIAEVVAVGRVARSCLEALVVQQVPELVGKQVPELGVQQAELP